MDPSQQDNYGRRIFGDLPSSVQNAPKLNQGRDNGTQIASEKLNTSSQVMRLRQSIDRQTPTLCQGEGKKRKSGQHHYKANIISVPNPVVTHVITGLFTQQLSL